METASKNKTHLIASPLIAGLVYAFIIMGVASLIVTLLLAFTSQQESSLPVYTYIIHLFSIFIGGVVYGKRKGSKGWYHGGLLGLFYAAIIIIVGLIGFKQGVHLQTAMFLLAAFSIGSLGGMIGINFKR